MTLLDLLRWLSLAGIVATALPADIFVVLYWRDPWRTTDVGRSLMAFAFADGIVFTLTITMFFLPAALWLQVLQVLLFATLFPFVGWWRLLVLLRVHRVRP